MIKKYLRFLFPLRDPVCRNHVSKDTPFSLEVDGKTYFFDSQACLTTFKDSYGRKGNRKKTFLENLAVDNKHVSGCCNG